MHDDPAPSSTVDVKRLLGPKACHLIDGVLQTFQNDSSVIQSFSLLQEFCPSTLLSLCARVWAYIKGMAPAWARARTVGVHGEKIAS